MALPCPLEYIHLLQTLLKLVSVQAMSVYANYQSQMKKPAD